MPLDRQKALGLWRRRIGRLIRDSEAAYEVFTRKREREALAEHEHNRQANTPPTDEVPGQWELVGGKMTRVLDASRLGWWRYHEHYDRDGYCDNPARGY